MSSVKRRINSTGRKKIARELIEIQLVDTDPGETPKANVEMNLQELEFPDSAAVVVEAYHKSSGMRFDCGTIGNLKLPDVFDLNEIDQGGNILFRVKVVDREISPGLLLASAEGIRPYGGDNPNGRQSIFPVEQRDLSDEVWRVDVDEIAGPVLLLNSRIPAIKQRLLNNAFLQGAILPHAMRIVLQYIAKEPSVDDDSGWKEQWLEFCRTELGVDDDPSDLDTEERIEWVENLVHQLSRNVEFVPRIREINMETN